MPQCRQCGSWSVVGHNHRKVIRQCNLTKFSTLIVNDYFEHVLCQ